MLTNEMKLQVFLKLRFENYRASLRLEGLVPPPVNAESLLSTASLNMHRTNDKHDQINYIGHLLGRDIPLSRAGDVNTFSAFTDADLAELRMLDQLSSPLALVYIRFRLKEGVTLQQAVSFRSEVLHQGESLEKWCITQGV